MLKEGPSNSLMGVFFPKINSSKVPILGPAGRSNGTLKDNIHTSGADNNIASKHPTEIFQGDFVTLHFQCK